MKFSEAWIREWVDPPVTTAELSEQLSMAGLEVDAITPVAGRFEGVVVGQVASVEPHPNADKLRVCQVDAGQESALQIVCGAANVAAGMRVPVARVGAVLPGDIRIRHARLRGVESHGMICSAAELGLEESSEGIMPLPSDAPVGEDVRHYLGLDDRSIELDLTPDRGDCLSVAGLAREVGVLNRMPVRGPEMTAVAAQVDDRFEVRVAAPQVCPRYVCRIVRGIDPSVQTPLWMRERLRRSGLRAINPVVDVTNYVLLELGQPMHGFDLARLDGHIEVRMARPGERITLLDGQTLELTAGTLLIADARQPLAMAGIMGGEGSGVSADTRDILLESAFFAPTSIIGKARTYGLHTDSSHRFERGVDPQLQVPAMERATRLLLDIAGGRPGPLVAAVAAAHLPQPKAVHLRRERVARVLGVEIEDAVVEDILARLAMTLEALPDGWRVTAPSSRFDIGIEADLIEEIGRIYGYTEIPISHAAASTRMHARPEARFDLDRARQLLVDRGYREVVTYSFIAPEQQRSLDPDHASIELANPISAEMSVMRTSLWPGLVQTARYNQSRQQARVRIFETGLRFIRGDDGIRQEPMLAGLIVGDLLPEQWSEQARPVDFFDLKGDIETLLAGTGCAEEFVFQNGALPALHPGQCARIVRNDAPAGWIGMLHPELQQQLELDGNCFLFEIALSALQQGRLPAFTPLSKFPSIRRDLALVVDRDVSFRQIRECVRSAAPQILTDILLFDVYTGNKVDSGRKSIALGLILQETSHTLTDQEVDSAVAGVLRAMATEIGARLRV